MKYYHRLYVSDGLREKKEEIIYKLEHDKFQLHKYVIVLAQSEKNHLEFYDAALLLQKIYKKETLFVVGIADGYDEALLLVKQITQEVYDKTKGADIRTYLRKQQREFEKREIEM